MACGKVLDGQPSASCGHHGINISFFLCACIRWFCTQPFNHKRYWEKLLLCNLQHSSRLVGFPFLFFSFRWLDSSQGTSHLIIPMSIAKEDLWIVQWSHYSWERGAEINKTGQAILPNYDFSFTKFTLSWAYLP
jgi:hypothetical protein